MILRKWTEEKIMICPRCGSQNRCADDKFCLRCGTPTGARGPLAMPIYGLDTDLFGRRSIIGRRPDTSPSRIFTSTGKEQISKFVGSPDLPDRTMDSRRENKGWRCRTCGNHNGALEYSCWWCGRARD